MLRARLIDFLAPASNGPMRYALDRRTFWFSHYLSTGLRTSSGILLIALLALWRLPPHQALAVAFGAAAMALVDQVGPWHSKMREMAVSCVLNTSAALLTGLLAPWPALQAVSTVLLTFGSAFLLLYGTRAMPIQFAMLLAMTLSMVHVDTRSDAITVSAGFLVGGLLYMVYALALAWQLQNRLKQQVLAECLFELAQYFAIKRDFYERHVDITQQYTRLIRQQVKLAEKQQAARDLVLQRRQGPDDAHLIQIHLAMLDLYEQALTTHTDYAALHRYFADGDVLLFLRDMIEKATRDVEAIAYAVTRGRPAGRPVSYAAERRAIEFELHLLAQQADTPGDELDERPGANAIEPIVLLRSTYYKVLELVTCIDALRTATVEPATALPPLNMGLFVSRPRIAGTMLRRSLRLESPIMRYALRLSLAMVAALVLGHVLPYASHPYWIMLTIVIIMKPSYSITRQRRQQRLIGTAIGCLLAAVILQVLRTPTGLMLVLYLSLMMSATFVQIRYLYTAIAASVTVMVLLSLTAQSGGTRMLLERLMDTGLGVLLATVFSHVFPNWERGAIPGLLRRMLDGARVYLSESRSLLLGDQLEDQDYRLARKQFLDEVAGVNAALLRMLDEPRERQQHGVAEINRLLIGTYLMSSHVAALRMMLRRQPQFQSNPTFRALVEHALHRAEQLVERARQVLTAPVPNTLHVDDHQEEALRDGSALRAWPLTEDTLPGSNAHSRAVLRVRVDSLVHDARNLLQQSAAVQQLLLQAAQR